MIYLQEFYKHLAPNGAKQDVRRLRSSVAVVMQSVFYLLGSGFPHAYDAFAASLITRSNVPGATLRKRVFRFRDTAMLIVGL